MDSDYPQEMQGHPYLHEPLLYITNLPSYVTDENLAIAFITCGPFRPKIPRDGTASVLSGTIEFKFLDKGPRYPPGPPHTQPPAPRPPRPLTLSPNQPPLRPSPRPLPSPASSSTSPPAFTDSQLYDLFRPYGALAAARTHTQFGPDTGMVEFWNEGDARAAEEALHCADVEGQNIAVQVYQPRRASGTVAEFSPNAPSFVPSGAVYAPYPTQYSPPRGSPYRSPVQTVQTVAPFVHGPGQQVQLAPLSGPGSSSHSGLIDPCNLFCKNLDADIDSNGLFTHFRQFGQIVSARVMRNESGDSRGFGFVSYQTPDQANAALHAMNGVQLGSKQIVVRLHEPKQLRQEKLAQRFGHNGHPRSSSGATSPTASEGGDSYVGWSSPRQRTSALGSPKSSYEQRNDRGRRGSGSYYNAALSGTLNLPMRYDDLAGLSPVVRKEVLTGELSRRIKMLDIVPTDDVDGIVESLVSVSLSEIVQCIESTDKLKDHVVHLKGRVPSSSAAPPASASKPAGSTPTDKSPSRSATASQDSRLLDPDALAATASAPEHPSTPISGNASLSTPPRTSSPSGSVPPTSERDRMLAAVARLEPLRQAELTDLLMSLPKRERAMCLFNAEVLRVKLVDAKMVLDSEEDEQQAGAGVGGGIGGDERSTRSAPQVPVTPQQKKPTRPIGSDSPQTPDLSSRGASAAASPLPATPIGSTTTTTTTSSGGHTIASLAKLPAAEIVRLATSSSATGLPLPKADPLVVQATDEFVDGLLDKPVQVQKQQLGDKLFKVVKSFGVKGAPKVTIALLDQEDLRALAHLMNSYPTVLKDKAFAITMSK